MVKPRFFSIRDARWIRMSAVVVQKSPGPDFGGEINHTAHTSFGRAGLTTPSEKVTEKLRERQTAGLSSYTPEGYPFFSLHFALPPSISVPITQLWTLIAVCEPPSFLTRSSLNILDFYLSPTTLLLCLSRNIQIESRRNLAKDVFR